MKDGSFDVICDWIIVNIFNLTMCIYITNFKKYSTINAFYFFIVTGKCR